MPKYALLLHEDESGYEDVTNEAWEEAMAAHGRFTERVPALGGEIVGGYALLPSSTATSVRGDVVTDGPFVETKEVFGGYYVIEVADLDTAVEIAKTCPVDGGRVEVRALLEPAGP